ncbi:hypothetical protein [Microbulbifer sp. TYP-18]|uniref:hypothetical protein n=1 Tax=Microbulbifer sp. TYP-18 TaxID=3230024 RepID=UPI0034C66F6F
MPGFLIITGGLASACAGILLLYVAWRHKGTQPMRSLLGWGLLLLSAWVWSSALGVEYGISIATLIAMLTVFILIGLTGEWPTGPSAPERQRKADGAARPARLWLRGTARFFAVVILPAVSGVVAGLLLFGVLGIADGSRLIAAAFCSITVWTLAVVWCCADKILMRPGATLAAFSLIGGLWLMPAG